MPRKKQTAPKAAKTATKNKVATSNTSVTKKITGTRVKNNTNQKQVLMLGKVSLTLMPNEVKSVDMDSTKVEDLLSYVMSNNIVTILKK